MKGCGAANKLCMLASSYKKTNTNNNQDTPDCIPIVRSKLIEALSSLQSVLIFSVIYALKTKV